jgi:hypothetical protein
MRLSITVYLDYFHLADQVQEGMVYHRIHASGGKSNRFVNRLAPYQQTGILEPIKYQTGLPSA